MLIPDRFPRRVGRDYTAGNGGADLFRNLYKWRVLADWRDVDIAFLCTLGYYQAHLSRTRRAVRERRLAAISKGVRVSDSVSTIGINAQHAGSGV